MYIFSFIVKVLVFLSGEEKRSQKSYVLKGGNNWENGVHESHMKKILITGGAGFLGAHLNEKLIIFKKIDIFTTAECCA